jgi:hypothetical protein
MHASLSALLLYHTSGLEPMHLAMKQTTADLQIKKNQASAYQIRA